MLLKYRKPDQLGIFCFFSDICINILSPLFCLPTYVQQWSIDKEINEDSTSVPKFGITYHKKTNISQNILPQLLPV